MAAKKARRTTHRSTTGRKLYAKRSATGRFEDIQTYERAHRADLAKRTKTEKAAAKKRVVKKAAKKPVAKKAAKKRTAAKKKS